MMQDKRQALIDQGDQWFSPLGLYVVDVEIEAGRQAPLFRFFVDRVDDETVTVGDTARAGRLIRTRFEEQGRDENSYYLEVSSPGVERRIARARDFRRFVGRAVRVRLKDALNGRKKFDGTIVRADDAAVVLQWEEEEELTLPYPRIARANLKFDFARLEEG